MTTLHRDDLWRDLTASDCRPWPDYRLRGRGLAGRREQPSLWAYALAIALWGAGVYQVLDWLLGLLVGLVRGVTG